MAQPSASSHIPRCQQHKPKHVGESCCFSLSLSLSSSLQTISERKINSQGRDRGSGGDTERTDEETENSSVESVLQEKRELKNYSRNLCFSFFKYVLVIAESLGRTTRLSAAFSHGSEISFQTHWTPSEMRIA